MKIILKIGAVILILVCGGVYAFAGTYSKTIYCYEQSGNLYALNITEKSEYTITKVSKGSVQFEEIETGKCAKSDSAYTFTSKDNTTFSGELSDKTIVISGTIDNNELSSTPFSKAESTIDFLKMLFAVYQG